MKSKDTAEFEASKIEDIVGYVFRDKALLERAFTHDSKSSETTKNYQSLEFLGDSILDFIIAKRLMELDVSASAGESTRRKANIVSRQPLAEVSDMLQLPKFLQVGKGENQESISEQIKIKCDIYESLIAALYYDSGDISVAEAFILRTLNDKIASAEMSEIDMDFKSQINEYASKRGLKVQYKLAKTLGSAHSPIFYYQLLINNVVTSEGKGHSKREAEQNASKSAMEKFNKQG